MLTALKEIVRRAQTSRIRRRIHQFERQLIDTIAHEIGAAINANPIYGGCMQLIQIEKYADIPHSFRVMMRVVNGVTEEESDLLVLHFSISVAKDRIGVQLGIENPALGNIAALETLLRSACRHIREFNLMRT